MTYDQLQEKERGTGVTQKLLYLAIGGGIGATLALLFAPKPGRELREDIADFAAQQLDQASQTATHLKERTAAYYRNAKETGSEVLDVVASGLSAVGEEVRSDASKIGHILAERHVDESKPRLVH